MQPRETLRNFRFLPIADRCDSLFSSVTSGRVEKIRKYETIANIEDDVTGVPISNWLVVGFESRRVANFPRSRYGKKEKE